jgi:hypothetical protein
MTNNLNSIPDGDIKLIEFCAGYISANLQKVVIEYLWRTEDGEYLINDSDGFALEPTLDYLIKWIDNVISKGEEYYYSCYDIDIDELKKELLTLDDVTNLKFIPENAEKLIEANFGEKIETLWEYYNGFEAKYVIDYGDKIIQKTDEDIINWIDKVSNLDPFKWTCYDVSSEGLKEVLVKKKYNI